MWVKHVITKLVLLGLAFGVAVLSSGPGLFAQSADFGAIEAGVRVTVLERVGLTVEGEVVGMAEPGDDIQVLRIDGDWVWGRATRDARPLTGWVHARHLRRLPDSSAVPVDQLLERVEPLFQAYEFVSVTLSAAGPAETFRIEAAGYAFDDWFGTRRPRQAWTRDVALEEGREPFLDFFLERSALLWQVGQTGPSEPGSEKDHGTRFTLLFHSPQPKTLQIDSTRSLRLSSAAQQHLRVHEISDYPAVRRVLIFAEPHEDVDAQFALFQGLKQLAAENPVLTEPGETVFLTEGTAAGQVVCVRPLIDAARDPSDLLVRGVLDTHLIPGHVAYAWKTDGRVPILGVEHEGLYRLCARMTSQPDGPASAVIAPANAGTDAWQTRLYEKTVVARNASMVRTLIGQIDHHPTVLMFIGAGHLQPWHRPPLDPEDWAAASQVLDDAERSWLDEADCRGVRDMLKERSIGYYLLTPRTHPVRNWQQDQQARDRYLALMQAQSRGEVHEYIRALRTAGPNCTVEPSPDDAADFLEQLGEALLEALVEAVLDMAEEILQELVQHGLEAILDRLAGEGPAQQSLTQPNK